MRYLSAKSHTAQQAAGYPAFAAAARWIRKLIPLARCLQEKGAVKKAFRLFYPACQNACISGIPQDVQIVRTELFSQPLYLCLPCKKNITPINGLLPDAGCLTLTAVIKRQSGSCAWPVVFRKKGCESRESFSCFHSPYFYALFFRPPFYLTGILRRKPNQLLLSGQIITCCGAFCNIREM